jgi:hypothetical protein
VEKCAGFFKRRNFPSWIFKCAEALQAVKNLLAKLLIGRMILP